jgi:hypothetical protein
VYGAKLNIDKSAIIFLGPPFLTKKIQVVEKGRAVDYLGSLGAQTSKAIYTKESSRNLKIDAPNEPPSLYPSKGKWQ